MYKIVKRSQKWYAVEITDLENDLENLEISVNAGELVIYADNIDIFKDEFFEDVEVID